MLRRKILTSAMASVMALTSVSVVAFADDAATDVKNVKTKADLEAYVKSFDGFREKELYDYGSISGENFLNALEYADNVLADEDSEVEDFTAAYAMVEAVYNRLRIYTASDLRDLLNSCKKIYETNNIYNEELGDAIYDGDTFSEFEGSYEDAESVLNSSDSRIITDAYEQLDADKKGLKMLDTVTKSQFRSALKAYETALQKEFAYDSWRIGTLEGTSEATGWALWAYDGLTVAYGTLYEHVASLEASINSAYSELDAIKALSKTSQVNLVDAYKQCVQATAVLNGFKADDTNRATKASVQGLLNQYHGRLVYDYNTTAAKNLYDAVIAAVGIENVTVLQAKNDYSTEMKPATSVTDPWCVDKASYEVKPNDTWGTSVEKIISAEITIKSKVAFYIVQDSDGNATGAVSTTKPAYGKLISKNASCDLTDYIDVPLSNVTTGTDNHLVNNVIDGDDSMRQTYPWGSGDSSNQIGKWGAISGAAQDMDGSYLNSSKETVPTHTDLATALEIADLYINGSKDDIKENTLIEDIDTIGAISEGSAKGASTEWTLVYRYLKYALADKYDASYGTNTKSEVVDLIDKCYELAELTGDAALFNYNHTRLVRARQDALEWVKAANKIKTYKDNVTSAEVVYASDKIIYGNLVATDVYSKLKAEYDNLMNDYEAFKYSFGQIYDYLNEVSDLIDEGKVVTNDNIKKYFEDTAYYLSTVESLDDALTTNDTIDNDAFTADRFFQDFNRVYTKGDNEYELALAPSGSKVKVQKSSENAASMSHQNLKDAYDNLKKEIDAQINPTAKLGDVNKDGAINSIDAALILKAAADGTVDTLDKAVADFNTDGSINAIDAAAILKGVADGTLK